MAGSSKKVIYAALIGNSLVAVTKFAAAAMTGSSAMLSEGIHSVVDTGNQGLLLYGLHRAKAPPDSDFPFGHGKEVYFWSFIVAILIFALGGGISIYEGIHQILAPRPLQSPHINYIVLGLAIIFEGAALYFAVREFAKVKGDSGYIAAIHHSKDPTLFVVLFEDSAALLGLLVALLGVWLTHATGIPYFDGAASIVIGLLLAATAAFLAYETKSLLIGERARLPVVKGIREIVRVQTGVDSVNEVLTMHMGPEFVLVNLSVDFGATLSADEVEKAIARMDRLIKEAFPKVKRIFIEAESRKWEKRDRESGVRNQRSGLKAQN